MTLAVLMTCHNRREKTLACLGSIFEAFDVAVDFEVFLTDDGSSDGTADAVLASYPSVHVIEGDGSLFWCRGMHRAWLDALDGEFDAYLWVNDDVVFRPTALREFIENARQHMRGAEDDAIVVGSVTDPATGELTYGGSVQVSTWHPGRTEKVEPTDDFQVIDTFNGNVVLVPHFVVERVGIIDPAFSHATGDNDYGLRAKAAGIPVLLAPGTAGMCARNPALPPSPRRMFSRKGGLPWRDWLRYTRRHGDWRWPVAFLLPYIRMAFAGLALRRGQSNEHQPES